MVASRYLLRGDDPTVAREISTVVVASACRLGLVRCSRRLALTSETRKQSAFALSYFGYADCHDWHGYVGLVSQRAWPY